MNSTKTEDQSTAHLTALRERVVERMAREKISTRSLATILGMAHQSISRWLKATHRDGESEAVTAAFSSWMSATRAPEPSETFVTTPAARKVIGALAHARKRRDMVCVYGGPGVGKTRSIRHFQATSADGVWVATMTPSSSALVSSLEAVAEAVGVRDVGGGARRLSHAIRRQVGGRGGIIIIDESQHLSMAAVEELRAIHDACGVALALVGNETSYARLTGGTRAANYAQIYSRIGMRLFVHKPTRDDVVAICKALGVTNKDSVAFLERLAMRPGALRGVCKCIQLAQDMRDDDVTDVPVDELRDACLQLGTEV